MLYAKEKMFDWVIPTIGTPGRVITEDLRINLKYSSLYVGYNFLEKYYSRDIDYDNVKVAFVGLNSSERPFLVINPNPGVPFFKFRLAKGKKGKNPSPSFCSKPLCLLFKQKFMAKEGEILSFDLEPFEKFNGMMFYLIKPISI